MTETLTRADMDRRPTRDDKFSFGLWTVGWQARDLFGEATRPLLATVEAVDRLADGYRRHGDQDVEEES